MNSQKAPAKTANAAYAAAIAGIRRSNAAGTHQDKRRRRARTRTAALRRALAEATA